MLENNINHKAKKMNITGYCCCPTCWKTSKMLDSCSSSSAACSGLEAIWPRKYSEQRCQDVSGRYSSSLANKALPSSLYVDQLLVCLIGSPGWLLVTLLHEELWCRHRGHWRSGPRHPSPLCTVCTEENHGRDIHSLPHLITHSHSKQQDNRNKNSPNLTDAKGTSKMLNIYSSSGLDACRQEPSPQGSAEISTKKTWKCNQLCLH